MKVMVAFLGKKNKHKKNIENIVKKQQSVNSISNLFNDKKKNTQKIARSNRLEDFNLRSINDILESRKNNKSNKSNKKIHEIKQNRYHINENRFSYMALTVIFSVLLFYGMMQTKICNSVIKFGTNFRQAQNNPEYEDLVSVFGIYNANNYIFDKQNVANDIQKAESNNKSSSEEQIIDDVAKAALEEAEAVFANGDTNVTITDQTSTLQRVTVGDFKVLNYSSKRSIDYASLMKSNITLTKKSDKILLYNTHTSESYTNSDGYKFEYSGTMRSMDANYNMLAIASHLRDNLNSKGFEAVHNTTPHDYGTYNSAYAKSRITVKDALVQMGGAGISIDVHRDATADLSYRPVAQVNGVQVAQLMLVMGVGTDSTPNANWEANLGLALKLQQVAQKVYPGLFKPMIIRNSVYNQDLNKYSLLIEFGATGNTIEEVKLATRCLTNLLNIIYKD